MKRFPSWRWFMVLAMLAVTNIVAYNYGKAGGFGSGAESSDIFDDEDVIIIFARPEKSCQGDTLDEEFFRAHLIAKETPYLCVGKGNLLKFRGHMYSRKPLEEGQKILIPFFQ